jgi:hypothetical protein
VIDGWNKLIDRPDTKEFYDLKKDPDDRTDIVAENPEITPLSPHDKPLRSPHPKSKFLAVLSLFVVEAYRRWRKL